MSEDLRDGVSWFYSCFYLSEFDGEDGMRFIVDVVYFSRRCGTVDIFRIYKFFYIIIILY